MKFLEKKNIFDPFETIVDQPYIYQIKIKADSIEN
jgi:hypothetical protein